MSSPNDILNFWFGQYDAKTAFDAKNPKKKLWYLKDDKFDQQIQTQFGQDLEKAQNKMYRSWEEKPRDCLALIILFDQFSRNIFRNKKESFSFDPLALDLCLQSISKKADKNLFFVERSFFYMPLMHSENLEIQNQSLKMFQELKHESDEKGDVNANLCAASYQYAQMHFDIIKEFGRYPHRNEILGRVSTPEEIEFLSKSNSSF